MLEPIATILNEEDWLLRAKAHREKFSDFAKRHVYMRTHGIKDPVYDFMFDYYSFSSGQLLRWTPGIKTKLLTCSKNAIEWPDHVRYENGYCSIDPKTFPLRRVPYLRWAIQFLTETLEKDPVFHCFGLHEWAMLYKADEKRHSDVPLRVSKEQLQSVVEESPIRCTHYDAFRFFTEEAKPLNKLELSRENVMEHDQPGCIHANMDLYRFAYKVAPFFPSELLGELFLLARFAREIDMRASPYDLTREGLTPVAIETKQGREEYVILQKTLFEKAKPYRKRLLSWYQALLDEVLDKIDTCSTRL